MSKQFNSEQFGSEPLRVVAAQVERRCLPLKSPYVLSFATLTAFETLLIQLHLDHGETWWGEVVPLPGYASETVEDVLHTVASWLPHFPGQEVQYIRQQIACQIAAAPFASSLILSAIDTGLIGLQPFSDECTTLANSVSPLNPPTPGDFDSCSPQNWGARNEYTTLANSVSPLNPPTPGDFDSCSPQNWGARGAKPASIPPTSDRARIPLVYPTASAKPDLEQQIERAIAAGYRTIKVKVGECLEQDLDALPKLQRSLSAGTQVRFDANQGYTPEAARSFLQAVETQLAEYTELVEQPLSPDAWDEMAKLADQTHIPLMLDESIYTLEQVDRAKQVGCQWIKLKLCKQGGAPELLQMAKYAKQIGLKVVIGNGVATDIANGLELNLYHTYPQLFDSASESNGFAKLQQSVLHTILGVESGCAVWEKGRFTGLDFYLQRSQQC